MDIKKFFFIDKWLDRENKMMVGGLVDKKKMDGWVDKKIDEWLNGYKTMFEKDKWMVGWTEKKIEGQLEGQTNGWLNGYKKQMDGWIDTKKVEKWLDGNKHGWIGRKNGWMVGWIDKTKKQMDG